MLYNIGKYISHRERMASYSPTVSLVSGCTPKTLQDKLQTYDKYIYLSVATYKGKAVFPLAPFSLRFFITFATRKTYKKTLKRGDDYLKQEFTRFTLRITKEQDKKITVLADKMNMQKAELIRKFIDVNIADIEKLIQEQKETEKQFKILAFQLQKIGVVLNQCNRNFYDNKSEKISEVKKGIDELWQYLKVLKE